MDETPTITPEVVSESPLQVVIKENNLELESAQFLLLSFEPLLKQAQDWAAKVANIKVTDASQTREMKLARETRLALREIRINTDKKRKSLTEDGTRRNRAINGAANIIKFLVEPLEEKLEAQEKFVELQEAKRKSELKQSRLMLLAPYNVDTSFYTLEEMPESVFNQLLDTTKTAFDAKAKEAQRVEAERVETERKRIAEQEATRIENEKLKAEAAAKDAAAAIERKKAQDALNAAQEAARKQKEASDAAAAAALAEERKKASEAAAKLAAEQKKVQEEAAKKLQAEQKAREAAEAAKKKAEADAKAVADAQKKKDDAIAAAKLAEDIAKKEAARKAASAPDKEKLLKLAADIRGLSVPAIPQHELTLEIQSQKEKFALWIEKKANSLHENR